MVRAAALVLALATLVPGLPPALGSGPSEVLSAAAAPARPDAPAALFDAQGYRSASYRAPVNRAPFPARRITLAAARRLHPERGALFVDVLAAEGAHRDAVSGQWTLIAEHESIPGALWFPDVGHSAPDPVLWRAFADRVATFRKAHPKAPVIVFCRTDCWMSWNAARRLAYAHAPHILWLPEGIEGWRDAGGTLAKVQPEQTRPEQTRPEQARP